MICCRRFCISIPFMQPLEMKILFKVPSFMQFPEDTLLGADWHTVDRTLFKLNVI